MYEVDPFFFILVSKVNYYISAIKLFAVIVVSPYILLLRS